MIVSGTILLKIVANYAGQHRVCYRQGNSGPYTCALVSCVGGGAECDYPITVSVDNETCDPVEYQGYVQPACVDISSTDDRVEFTYTFTPSPTCLKYTVQCNNSGVGGIIISNAGTGYIPGSPPVIVISGGGGTGATAVAVIGTGFITTTNIIFNINGAGYTNGVYTNVPLLGGSGTGAKATLSVVAGAVVSGTITTPGNGYFSGETLTPDESAMGPSFPITPASFNITSDYGTITAINVTAPGSGYTSAPAVTIPPSGGVTGLATAGLAPCPDIDAVGCSGGGLGIIPGLDVGESVQLCKTGAVPTPSPEYSVTPNGNCACACIDTTIGVTGSSGSIGYVYNRCNGDVIQGTLDIGGSPSTINDCIVVGSLKTRNLSGDAAADIVLGSSCS